MDRTMADITELAATLHQRLNVGIEAWQHGYRLMGGKVHCGKGCDSCCTLTVNCALPEAVRLSQSLTESRRNELSKYIDRLYAAIPRLIDLKRYLDLHRKELGPCPFLDTDGSCCIYPVRPSSCRSLISTRESRWCAQDFAALDSSEKQEFMDSLDQTVVAFPMHYAAAPQEMAADVEASLNQAMRDEFGYTVYGNMPLLVHMELKHRLSSRLTDGRREIEALFTAEGVGHPLLALIAE